MEMIFEMMENRDKGQCGLRRLGFTFNAQGRKEEHFRKEGSGHWGSQRGKNQDERAVRAILEITE